MVKRKSKNTTIYKSDLSIKKIALELIPILQTIEVNQGHDFSLDPLLLWPPNLFAFTSRILSNTGVYHFVISPPPGRSWPPQQEFYKPDLFCFEKGKNLFEEYVSWDPNSRKYDWANFVRFVGMRWREKLHDEGNGEGLFVKLEMEGQSTILQTA